MLTIITHDSNTRKKHSTKSHAEVTEVNVDEI